MNILFLANRLPYPPHRGDKLKIYNLAKHLHKSHNLYLLTFIQDKSEYQYVNELKKFFREIRTVYLPKYKSVFNCLTRAASGKPFQINYFYSQEFKTELNKFLCDINIDLIHTQHLRMSQYSHDANGIKTILDLPDAYSLYWKRRASLNGGIVCRNFSRLEYERVKSYENILKKFDLNLVCSDEDKNYLMENLNIENIGILPNGIDLEAYSSDFHDYGIENKLVFTGNMSYYPNVDAACYFVNDIFPLILKKFPSVKFYISGQNPSLKVKKLESENVIVTGFVKSLRRQYESSAVAVSPVRVGAGTLNKVLEPMAMGLPVVSTSVGFKGLGAVHGKSILHSDSPVKFAEAVIHLLDDKNLRASVGESGRRHVTENFGWEKIAVKLENHMRGIFNYNYAV
ncbi:MAG: hypothetical protein HGGPFJEG_01706 [Ignavibacteria bacterium]|nr:hypothetical protein [Ignavibacteria bacterium]